MQTFTVEFDLLGAVEVEGMRAEIRVFPDLPVEDTPREAPTNILTFLCQPGPSMWSRRVAERGSEFSSHGPLAFRPRAAVWETRSTGGPALAVMSFFDDPSLLPGGDEELGRPCIEDFSMIELMRLLHDEIRRPGFASETMVGSIAEILRVKLARLSAAASAPRAQPAAALRNFELSLIRDFIEARRGGAVSVAELAELCGLSRRSLLRRFRSTTGVTVAAYIAKVQLAKSQRLLATSRLSLKQIAYEAGFSNPNHFATAFKRQVGVTPSAFRRNQSA